MALQGNVSLTNLVSIFLPSYEIQFISAYVEIRLVTQRDRSDQKIYHLAQDVT